MRNILVRGVGLPALMLMAAVPAFAFGDSIDQAQAQALAKINAAIAAGAKGETLSAAKTAYERSAQVTEKEEALEAAHRASELADAALKAAKQAAPATQPAAPASAH